MTDIYLMKLFTQIQQTAKNKINPQLCLRKETVYWQVSMQWVNETAYDNEPRDYDWRFCMPERVYVYACVGVTQDIGRGVGESVVHSFRRCHMRLASPSLPFSMPVSEVHYWHSCRDRAPERSLALITPDSNYIQNSASTHHCLWHFLIISAIAVSLAECNYKQNVKQPSSTLYIIRFFWTFHNNSVLP